MSTVSCSFLTQRKTDNMLTQAVLSCDIFIIHLFFQGGVSVVFCFKRS